MRIDFSEFAYGHAVIREVESILCDHQGEVLIAAPDLPSLRRERRVGYDVRLDTDASVVALQFKLGEYVKQPRMDSPTWHQRGVDRPHFRVRFTANDHQIQLMRDLEAFLAADPRDGIAHYLAPAFSDSNDFTINYVHGHVLDESYGCAPSAVPCDASDHHLVCVPSAPRRVLMCSDPVEVRQDGFRRGLVTMDRARRDRTEGIERGDRSVPRVVTTTERVLIDHALSSSPADAHLDRIVARAAQSFPGRPDLEHGSIAIELGSAFGLTIGFTATVR